MFKRKIVIIAIILIAIILSAFLFFRFHGGIDIKAENRSNIAFPVISFMQKDERWAGDTLGASSYTMKTSGCVTTCIASALSRGMDEITPGNLNRLFSENDVYDARGNLQWQELKKLGYNADVLTKFSEDTIYNYLRNCQFPIARVRVNGIGSFHYVLIVGIENGEYICMDPLEDNLTPLSDYWSKVYAVRVVY